MKSAAAQPDDGAAFSLDSYAAAVNTAARAAKARRATARTAEPLLAGLPNSGTFRYSSAEYKALARYLLDYEPAKTNAALTVGRFIFGALEFVRDASLTTGPTMSVSEFARASGKPKQTVSYRVGQFRPRSIGLGKRKRYYVADLQALFAN